MALSSRSDARALLAATTLSAAGAIPPLLVGALGVQLKVAFDFGDRGLGAQVSVFFAVAAVTTVFAGRLADRIGWERALWLTAGLVSVALMGAGALATSAFTLGAFLLIGGLGFALTTPTANLILVRELGVRRLGLAFGIKQASVPAAGLLAGMSVPTLALTIGWRWAFALMTLLPLLAVASVPRRRPGTGGRTGIPAGEVRLMPGLGWIGVGGGLAAASIGGLSAFLVVASVDAGLSEAAAGWLVAASASVGLLVRVLGGWLVDARQSDGFAPVISLLCVGALGFALLATHRPVAVVVGGLLAYGGAWGWPGLFHFGVVRHHRSRPASATGVVQIGLAAGVAVGPVAFGELAERHSYVAGWSSAALLAAAAAVFVLVGTRRLVRVESPDDPSEPE